MTQDISGFSALNEFFSQQGGDGLGTMMSLVNMYFQQMIKITSANGGDVIKFAGDALIVLWTGADQGVLAHRACECALELQDVLHDSPMTQTIRLSLKAGIGIGPVTMFYVGGHEGKCEYFAAGPALRESFDACDLAASGDVIISTAVLNEVKDVCREKPNRDGFFSLMSMEKTFRKKSVNRMARPAAVLSSDALQSLRGFAPPVLLSAQHLEGSLNHQSVRGWTVSVVQASVLFVNLGIGGVMDGGDLDCAKIHAAVIAVQRIIATLQGCIHRFTVDDKGCVMKIVFGAHLPHEDQPYRALHAALQVRHQLSLQGIQPSVGVASGESLIGPVGSAVRQEFTVHGDKIILAARLMQLAGKYGGMVLCDEATFLATRDDVRFVPLRPVALKGKSTTVRPYRPVASSELLEKPTLTNKPEHKYCTSLEPIRRAMDTFNAWLSKGMPEFRALVITGDHGSGKTQLIMQARSQAEPSCRVLHVRCREHERAQRGALLRRIFAQLCGHDVWPSLQHIAPMFSGSTQRSAAETALIEYELKLIRSHTAAAVEPSAAGEAKAEPSDLATDETDLARILSNTSRRNSEPSAPTFGRLVLIIDDVTHADAHSCELLRQLGLSAPPAVMLLLTCREPRVSLSLPSTPGSSEVGQLLPGHRLVHALSNKRDTSPESIITCHLRSLSATGCDELARADIGVEKLPFKVLTLLTKRSGGSPLLCLSIVRNLVHRGALQVLPELASGCKASCKLGSSTTDRSLNAAATEALVAARHSVLCVKLAELSMLQQLIVKTMSLLPEPCSQGQLMQAMPVHLDMPTLVSQLRLLREHHLIAAPPSHRRSLPGTLSPTTSEASYMFVDIGMHEVCQHLMVDSQKRQIRLRIAATDESKLVLGSLADSISGSFNAEELARSLSPNMLRASKLRSSHQPSKLQPPTPNGDAPRSVRRGARGSVCGRGSVSSNSGEPLVSGGDDKQWWLPSSHSAKSPTTPTRLTSRAVVQPSPSRLHQRTGRRDPSPMSSRLSGRSALSQFTMSSTSSSKLSPSLPSWARVSKRHTGDSEEPAGSSCGGGEADCSAAAPAQPTSLGSGGMALVRALSRRLGPPTKLLAEGARGSSGSATKPPGASPGGFLRALVHRLLAHPAAVALQQKADGKVHPGEAQPNLMPTRVKRRTIEDADITEQLSPSTSSFVDSLHASASSDDVRTPGRNVSPKPHCVSDRVQHNDDFDRPPDWPSPMPSAPEEGHAIPLSSMRPTSMLRMASDDEEDFSFKSTDDDLSFKSLGRARGASVTTHGAGAIHEQDEEVPAPPTKPKAARRLF